MFLAYQIVEAANIQERYIPNRQSLICGTPHSCYMRTMSSCRLYVFGPHRTIAQQISFGSWLLTSQNDFSADRFWLMAFGFRV